MIYRVLFQLLYILLAYLHRHKTSGTTIYMYRMQTALGKKTISAKTAYTTIYDPFCRDVPKLNKALKLFECLLKDDLERRINGNLRLPAFTKGNDRITKV